MPKHDGHLFCEQCISPWEKGRAAAMNSSTRAIQQCIAFYFDGVAHHLATCDRYIWCGEEFSDTAVGLGIERSAVQNRDIYIVVVSFQLHCTDGKLKTKNLI